MSTWTKKKLGDVTTVNSGYPFKSGTFVDGGEFGLVTIKNVQDNRFDQECTSRIDAIPDNVPDYCFLAKDDILLSLTGNVGRVCRVSDGKFLLNQRVAKLSSKPGYDADFLFSYIRQPAFRERLERLSNGVAQMNLSPVEMQKLEVVFPDLPTQSRIASILSAHDDLIENNEKRIKVLDEMASRLYTEWFVKFRFPGHEKVKMVDSGTEFGMIPEGWKVRKLGEVSSIVRGCSYSSDEIDDYFGNYYIVNLKSFNRGGGFRFDGAKYYSGSINENQILKTGDVVVAVTDMTNDRAVIARPARVPQIDGKITFSADVVKINTENLPSSFIYQLLSSYRFTETTKQKANGANVLHLKPAAILEFVALIPEVQQLKTFETLCGPTNYEIDKLLKQNDNLSKTRELLIPMLVTGKREIK